MSEEVFDVVNERDEVVGQAPRSEVHREGWLHRAVHILVFNSKGEVFLQQRSMLKDCFPGVWDSSAAGHLESGEDYDQSSVRELEEELGWKVDRVPEKLFKVAACEETGWEFVWVYRCEAEGPFVLHPEEISDGRWFERRALQVWMDERPGDFAPSLPYIWREAVKRGLV
ncbi:MAG: NUDIX hydrolase [Limisphaerales bacterium]|jgi:isopentenyl-diphosphate delta-isomerase type 1